MDWDERTKALQALKKTGAKHIVYGYRTGAGEDTKIDYALFDDDKTYVAYIDRLQGQFSDLSAVYAVHS